MPNQVALHPFTHSGSIWGTSSAGHPQGCPVPPSRGRRPARQGRWVSSLYLTASTPFPSKPTPCGHYTTRSSSPGRNGSLSHKPEEAENAGKPSPRSPGTPGPPTAPDLLAKSRGFPTQPSPSPLGPRDHHPALLLSPPTFPGPHHPLPLC